MSINKSFLTELQQEVSSTRKIIACVPTDKWDWKPHAKSMSLGDLSKHIVELILWTELVTQQATLNFHSDYKPLEAKTTAELLQLIDAYEQRAVKALEGMPEEDWIATWALKAGEHTIMELPKVAANRFVVNNHMYHHRGQLSVYLRLLDIPIPGMYGPSADDAK